MRRYRSLRGAAPARVKVAVSDSWFLRALRATAPPRMFLRNIALLTARSPALLGEAKFGFVCTKPRLGKKGSRMSQADLIWAIAKQHIIRGLEEWSTGWRPNGPSEHVMRQTLQFIRSMPLPKPEVER